jgi:hypothetical protein
MMMPTYQTIEQRALVVPGHIKWQFKEDLLLAMRNGAPLQDEAGLVRAMEEAPWYPAALLAYSFEYERRARQNKALRNMKDAMRDLNLID